MNSKDSVHGEAIKTIVYPKTFMLTVFVYIDTHRHTHCFDYHMGPWPIGVKGPMRPLGPEPMGPSHLRPPPLLLFILTCSFLRSGIVKINREQMTARMRCVRFFILFEIKKKRCRKLFSSSCKTENKNKWPQIFPLIGNSSPKNVAAIVFCHCVLNIKSAAGSCFHLCKHTKKTSVVTRVFSLFTRNVR